MTNNGSAEVVMKLSHLSVPAHPSARSVVLGDTPSSPSEAMALYFVAARLVELHMLVIARDNSQTSAPEMTTTRRVLEDTRRALIAALAVADANESRDTVIAGPPTLSVVQGGVRRQRVRRGA